MAENTRSDHEAATPPKEGRQDHDAMRAGSLLPVNGPASSDTLAASGGLELPGGERATGAPASDAPVHEPIPGERDASTQMNRSGH